MITKYINKKITYTGRELSSLYAYKNFNVQGDSVIAFCGPCQVNIEHLVDQEDVKAKAHIYSQEMVHFIVEKFNLDLEEGIFRQRLYIAIIKEIIEEFSPKLKIIRSGNDLFINKKKLSVSIATLSPVSTLIHIGVNVISKDTPVPAIGLKDLKIAKETFIGQVFKKIEWEENHILQARSKVRGVN